MTITTAVLLALALPQIGPLDDPDGNPVSQDWILEPRAAWAALSQARSLPTALEATVGGACDGVAQALEVNADLTEGDAPTEIRYTPDGARYLIAHRDSNNLVEFDAGTNAFLRQIPVSGAAQHLAISPDGTRAYVSLVFEDALAIVDLTTGDEISLTGGIGLPGPVDVSADGTLVAVADLESQELVVIDALSGVELRRVGGMGFSSSLSFAPEPGAVSLTTGQLELFGDRKALHTDFFNDEIEIVDLVAGTSTVLPASARPRGFDITPDDAIAIVTHTSTDQVISVVDLAAGSITKTIAIGQAVGTPVAVDPFATKAVVAVQNAVVLVNLITDSVGASLSTASNNDLLATADGQYVLGVGFRGALVSFATESVIAETNNVVSTALGAVSPTSNEAVLVATTFGEDRLAVSTNGFAAGLVFQGGTGEGLEADSTRRVALSPDGTRAVTTNILSDTATVWDTASGEPLAVVQVGNRPSDVEITPDGTRAVVANLDSTFASIIDLTSFAVTDVPISTRGSEVEIASDGQFAYVAVVSGGDGVWRIDLGTESASGGKLLTGNMGSVGFPYTQSSGMELSPDGSTLAVCGSFTDDVTLIDTATWSIAATVTVGDFPVRATWANSSNRVYISNRDDDTLRPVRRVGASWGLLNPIAVGQWPYEGRVSPDGSTLYLIEYLDDTIATIDLASATRTGGVVLPDSPVGLELSPDGQTLYTLTGGWSASFGGGTFTITDSGDLHVVDTSGLTLSASLNNDWSPSGLARSADGAFLAVPTPRGDGLGIARLDQALVADTSSISLSSGGAQGLCLDFDAANAGALYLVVGTLSGTSPGTPLGGVLLPINVDAYTLLTLTQGGTSPFVNFVGTLDGLGEAQASLVIAPGSNLPTVTLVHAAVAVDPFAGAVTAASNAVALELVD